MELLAAFAVFLVGTFACMALGWSLSWGLALGLVCFTLVGLRRGLSLRALVRMAGEGARTSLVVLRILVLIGFLTALWRASGTIAFFVHTGLEWMHPSAFYLAAFLLASALSMAFGSSFGVAGTAGVILAAIARSGGASLAVTGGAVLSGAYLGERLSPASSSAALTACPGGGGAAQLSAADVADHAPAPGALPGVLRGDLPAAPHPAGGPDHSDRPGGGL